MRKFFFVIKYLKNKLSEILHLYKLKQKFPSVKFGERLDIQFVDRVSFGDNTFIGNNTIINCGGEWTGTPGSFKCGKNTFIGPGCTIYAAGGVTIGDNVLISPNVSLLSHQHGYSDPSKNYNEQPSVFSPIRIEDNVYIGEGASILPGVKVGSGAIVGVHAVVTRDVPAKTMVAGVPAKKIKDLG